MGISSAPRRGILGRMERGSAKLDEIESIVAHLHLLLNTRLGESMCAQDLGVVDFADVVHNFPVAMHALQQSIRATILQYEPRLRNIMIKQIGSADGLTLSFEISARLSGQSEAVLLHTELRASGQIQVSRSG